MHIITLQDFGGVILIMALAFQLYLMKAKNTAKLQVVFAVLLASGEVLVGFNFARLGLALSSSIHATVAALAMMMAYQAYKRK